MAGTYAGGHLEADPRWGMADIDYQLAAATPSSAPATTGTHRGAPRPHAAEGRPSPTTQLRQPARRDRRRLPAASSRTGSPRSPTKSARPDRRQLLRTRTARLRTLPTPETNTTPLLPAVHRPAARPTTQTSSGSTSTWSRRTADPTAPAELPTRSPRTTTWTAPAWHYDDDDGITKEKYRTWSQWRGYPGPGRTGGQESRRP